MWTENSEGMEGDGTVGGGGRKIASRHVYAATGEEGEEEYAMANGNIVDEDEAGLLHLTACRLDLVFIVPSSTWTKIEDGEKIILSKSESFIY